MDSCDTELTEALVNLLKPVATNYQAQMTAIMSSQTALEEKIDKLTEDLEQARQFACPPDVNVYLKKLQTARDRVVLVNHTLVAIRDRLTRLHHTAHQKFGALKASNEAAAQQLAQQQAETGVTAATSTTTPAPTQQEQEQETKEKDTPNEEAKQDGEGDAKPAEE
eukprot:TRINITY_DN66360_c9_g4_i1.p1 TRINITY_DN66360_c9_g4~~TRINITY_DN66360_c9_g4_i1.p1  ORF type:complete len:166 (+),score=19.74 TRINITY_DN66360_c9_g4_i1:70-567(+)